MPERPDLRKIAGDIKDALTEYPREMLVEILTYVFKEYVVEGPPPLRVTQPERLTDLEGLSFPELVQALQSRLDLPELSLLEVEGTRVLARVNGVLTPLDAGGRAGAAAGDEVQATGQAANPRAGIQFIEQPMRRPPARDAEPAGSSADLGAADPALQFSRAGSPRPREEQAGTVPRPRGLSVSGRPAGSAAPAAPPAAGRPAPATGVQPGRPPEGQAPPSDAAKPEPSGDDIASIRFSLLELD